MNSGEFYVPREYNYVGENKNFPAEIYKKSIEEKPLGNETADYGKELTTLQKKKASSKDGSKRSGKTLIDKMFNSIKSVTTTATVAASALIVTTVATNSVGIDHATLDVGCDYVEYEMQIPDVSDDCFVIISTPGEEDIEIKIQKDGIHKKR